MMTGKQTATLLMVCVGLVGGVLAGCGGTSPQVETAETAVKKKNYQKSLSKIEEALEKDSADTGAYLLRARVLRKMADSTTPPDEYKALHERAWKAEEQALAFDSRLRDEVKKRRKKVFQREIEQGKLAYNRANKNEKPDLYRRAIAHYGAASVTQADSARPVLNEAYARLRVGQRKKAIPILEEYAKRADTVSRRAYKVLGKLYLNNDQIQRAVDLLNQGVRTHPTDQDLQGLRLNAYNRAGRTDEALEAYRKQVERKPSNPLYRYNYGALLLKAKRYSEAIAQLKEAVEIRPDHAESQYNLGAAYVNAALARDDSIAMLERQKARGAERSPSPRADTTTPDTAAATPDTTTPDTAAAPPDTAASDTAAAATDPALSDTTSLQEQIKGLVRERDTLFRKAIPPLERARKMEGTGGPIRRDACRALMVAYVQTNRPNKAAQVEECTGFSQAER